MLSPTNHKNTGAKNSQIDHIGSKTLMDDKFQITERNFQ